MLYRIRLFLLILTSVLLLVPHCISDLASDRAAILEFRRAVGGRSNSWSINENSPCNWPGVGCENDRITFLRLPAYTLSGNIPVNTIGNLSELRTLSLRFNALSGPLPDLSRCTSLRNVFLQNNHFSGAIPSGLFTLTNLIRLDLSSNNLTGSIPVHFNNLTRLRTLFLHHNRFSESLPNFNLSGLAQFNVSNNELIGAIPNSLQAMPASAFSGNALCGQPINPCSADELSPVMSPLSLANPNPHKKSGITGAAIAGIVIGSVVGLFLLFLVLFLLLHKKPAGVRSIKEAETQEVQNRGIPPTAAVLASTRPNNKEDTTSTTAKKLLFFNTTGAQFDLEDLLRASAEVLGKGVYATSYKASLEMGLVVAVKRLKDVTVAEREFKESIEIIGSFNHENLVPLRAYYYSRDEKLLVFDYLPMGSLSSLLHGNKGGRTPLNWELRTDIALGSARAIAYLHGSNTSHGNIKSSNILLTKSFEARVADFCLANIVGSASTPTRVSGYRAPEVTDFRKVSHKADVYSFGVLLLELLTGKAPSIEEGVDLPRWVQSVVREEWTSEVFDAELLRYRNVEEQMVEMLQLAVDCCAQYPDKRPSIFDVIRRIEELRYSSAGEKQELQPVV